MAKSCFVIMPIGEVTVGNTTVTRADLRRRYDDLIKEALQRARGDLEVVRADDVASPGGITTDIFMRLMHSDYVVADITYPNPNVFYELGIRHACRPGTVLLRERSNTVPPFDVADLRHIEYENTPTGLKDLANRVQEHFDWIDLHPNKPDNQFLTLAELTAYHFQSYERQEDKQKKAMTYNLLTELLKHPDLIEVLVAHSRGTPLDPAEVLSRVASKPDALRAVLLSLISSGQVKI